MAIPETPLTRLEQYFNRVATGDGVIPNVPLTRIEQYLNRIATKDGAIPEVPLTRLEQYLAKIAGEDVAVPNVPLTRTEQYFAKIAGQESAVPEVPLTRTEQYLAEIAENGGGGDLPEWDFEWDYTMGKMSENGFSLSGSGLETMASNYCQLMADGGSIGLVPPTVQMQDQKGVAEIVLNVNDSRNAVGVFNACIFIGDGTVSAYLACNANNWVLRDNGNSANATVLAPLRKGVWQTIRIELNGATWALYIDGELISNSLDSSIVKVNNGIMQVSKGTTRYQSVKYKFGRL